MRSGNSVDIKLLLSILSPLSAQPEDLLAAPAEAHCTHLTQRMKEDGALIVCIVYVCALYMFICEDSCICMRMYTSMPVTMYRYARVCACTFTRPRCNWWTADTCRTRAGTCIQYTASGVDNLHTHAASNTRIDNIT